MKKNMKQKYNYTIIKFMRLWENRAKFLALFSISLKNNQLKEEKSPNVKFES